MARLGHRIHFYQTLAALEHAGVPRLSALGQQFPGPFGQAARRLRQRLEHGEDQLHEAMAHDPLTFSRFECSLVAVGERTGRLETIFRSLVSWYQLLLEMRQELISGLLYPALVYHVAAVLIPFISYVVGMVSGFHALLRAAFFVSLPTLLWLAIANALPMWRRNRAEAAARIDGLLLDVPLLGGALRRLNYARFFDALALGLDAGLGTVEATRLAAQTCSNAMMRQRLGSIGDLIDTEGCGFTEALRRVLPEVRRDPLVSAMMETGELSGAPDEMARQIAEAYHSELKVILRRVAVVLPVVCYLIVAVYVGWQIICFYGKLLQPVMDLL